jgi:hypothetical protein
MEDRRDKKEWQDRPGLKDMKRKKEHLKEEQITEENKKFGEESETKADVRTIPQQHRGSAE